MKNKKTININKVLKKSLYRECIGSIDSITYKENRLLYEIVISDYSRDYSSYIYVNEKEKEFNISDSISSDFDAYTLLRIFQIFLTNGYKFKI